MIFASFMPHRMHLRRILAVSCCTNTKRLNAALALTVRLLPQFLQTTLSAHLNLISSAVVRTLLVDTHHA